MLRNVAGIMGLIALVAVGRGQERAGVPKADKPVFLCDEAMIESVSAGVQFRTMPARRGPRGKSPAPAADFPTILDDGPRSWRFYGHAENGLVDAESNYGIAWTHLSGKLTAPPVARNGFTPFIDSRRDVPNGGPTSAARSLTRRFTRRPAVCHLGLTANALRSFQGAGASARQRRLHALDFGLADTVLIDERRGGSGGLQQVAVVRTWAMARRASGQGPDGAPQRPVPRIPRETRRASHEAQSGKPPDSLTRAPAHVSDLKSRRVALGAS